MFLARIRRPVPTEHAFEPAFWSTLKALLAAVRPEVLCLFPSFVTSSIAIKFNIW